MVTRKIILLQMQPCPDSYDNLFTVQSKKQTRDRGKCKYDHCSDCEVVLQEKLKGSVSSFVVFCGDLPILFNERSGWLFLHNTWLGLSSCCSVPKSLGKWPVYGRARPSRRAFGENSPSKARIFVILPVYLRFWACSERSTPFQSCLAKRSTTL